MRKLIFKNIKWLQHILAEIEDWEYNSLKCSFCDPGSLPGELFYIWNYARNNVPYYQDCPPYAWNAIPFLTRDKLNSASLRLLAAKGRGFYWNTSAGSTGRPVRFAQDELYRQWNIITKIHWKLQAGQEPGDLECRIWGSERDLYEGRETLKKRFSQWLYNRKDFNAFKMKPEQMESYARWITKNKPQWIEGYIDAMYEFCRFVDGTLPSPKGVLVSAGTCHKHMIDLIAKTFQCKVYRRYGMRELGAVACDCPEGNMHIASWNAFVEIIDHKVIITSLRNLSMPLIRYETGDMATGWGKCSCGRKTPVIENISGREMEAFKRKDGGVVLGVWLVHLFGVIAPRKCVDQVQAIQKDYDHVVLKVVPEKTYMAKHNEYDIKCELAEWIDKIRHMMGSETAIDIEFVDELVRLKSGKICYTMCMIK